MNQLEKAIIPTKREYLNEPKGVLEALQRIITLLENISELNTDKIQPRRCRSGNKKECHICHRKFKRLGIHVKMFHDKTAYQRSMIMQNRLNGVKGT